MFLWPTRPLWCTLTCENLWSSETILELGVKPLGSRSPLLTLSGSLVSAFNFSPQKDGEYMVL